MSDVSKFDFDVLTNLKGKSIEVYNLDSNNKITDLIIDKVDRALAHGKRFDAFSLLLTGPKEQHCPQGIYRFKNPAFGEESVFMTPNAQDSYHICISRENVQSKIEECSTHT
ncbi:hypothetical protein AB4238_20680 [Shewanella sp. 10N.286.45.A1]|uniref:DUF6916 family protein n=1 Tax=Shewanella sp. 10N.286.45.A1 TaxID=3229694 RepID=UPI003552EFC0